MVLLIYLHRYVFSDLSSKHGIFATAIQAVDSSLQKMKTDMIRYMYQITDSKLGKFLWVFKSLKDEVKSNISKIYLIYFTLVFSG